MAGDTKAAPRAMQQIVVAALLMRVLLERR